MGIHPTKKSIHNYHYSVISIKCNIDVNSFKEIYSVLPRRKFRIRALSSIHLTCSTALYKCIHTKRIDEQDVTCDKYQDDQYAYAEGWYFALKEVVQSDNLCRRCLTAQCIPHVT